MAEQEQQSDARIEQEVVLAGSKILEGLRYRTGRLGTYQPDSLDFSFDVERPGLFGARGVQPVEGHYRYTEEVGPDIEYLQSKIALGAGTAEYREKLAEEMREPRSRRGTLLVHTNTEENFYLEVSNVEGHAPTFTLINAEGEMSGEQGGEVASALSLERQAALLQRAAQIVSLLEGRLDKEITDHEVARLDWKIRSAKNQRRQAEFYQRVKLQGGFTWSPRPSVPPRIRWERTPINLSPSEVQKRIDDGNREGDRIRGYRELLRRTKRGTRS